MRISSRALELLHKCHICYYYKMLKIDIFIYPVHFFMAMRHPRNSSFTPRRETHKPLFQMPYLYPWTKRRIKMGASVTAGVVAVAAIGYGGYMLHNAPRYDAETGLCNR